MNRSLRAAIGWLEDLDGWLLVSVLVLSLLGVIMVYNAGSFRPEALRTGAGHAYYLIKHLTRLGLGLIVMFALARIDYRVLRRPWLNWGLLGTGVGLIAVTVLLAKTGLVDDRAGSARWIRLSFLPVQPVELVKVALVLFLADRCADGFHRLRERPARLAWVAAVPVMVALLLIAQPNYGNALVLFAISLVVLWLAGLPARWLGLMTGVAAVAGVVGFFTVSKIANRVALWWAGLGGQGSSYHVEQSLIGIGAGGWHGFGFGASHQRFWFLPESHTDFIFSVLGEELGLVGGLLTLAFFTIFALRGFRIARRAGDRFGRLVAAGLTSLIFAYAAINIAMVTGLLPVMGLPLPFLSYGGSALVTNLGAVGILMAIDRQGRQFRSLRGRWVRQGGEAA